MANERIHRGDAELVVTGERLVEPAPAIATPMTNRAARVVLPPPPETRLRPPSSWLRRR